MKKIIVRVLIALMVLVILAIVAAGLFLDRAVKTAVETFGPKLTKVDIKLNSVNLSLLSGSGAIKGLVVGNPAGYKSPSAISVGEASLSLKPGSLLSDKIVIKSIKLENPEITYETNLKKSNLSTILDNVQQATGGGQQESTKPQQPSTSKEAKPAKKLEVDDFLITGGKVHVSVTALGGGGATVSLPDIHLQNLGTGPDGITAAELTERVISAIEKSAAGVASSAVTDIGKSASGIVKDLGNTGSNAVQSVTKGINDLFKKK
jgi:uncharacterized protein involved in outer membrane biogenesis